MHKELEQRLLRNIITRIDMTQRRRTLLRSILGITLLAGSGAAILPAFFLLVSGLRASGFLDFASLLFSNVSAAFTAWQSLGLALLESLPALETAIFLTVIIMLIYSITTLATHARTPKNYAYH